MALADEYYGQYAYHYRNEYPIYMFIKNKRKYMKITENMGKKEIRNMHVKKLRSNIYESKRSFEKLISNYYNNYKYNSIYYENNSNHLHNNITSINFKRNNIHKYNAEIIYTYYHIYNTFLINKKYNRTSNLYRDFKIFIRENEIIETINNNNITINMFYKYSEKSYNFINFISSEIDKEKIINLIMMLELNIEKLYKLNKTCMYLLNDFLKDKYSKIYISDNRNNKIYCNNIKEKHNISDINKLCRNIPITYVGCKRKISDKVLNYMSLNINNNTKTFIELFAGSLCISYLIKNLYPNINIIAYENDTFLINFYNVLKNDYNGFISRLKDMINVLKKSNNQHNYLKSIINMVNKKLVTNYRNDIDLACYYYII